MRPDQDEDLIVYDEIGMGIEYPVTIHCGRSSIELSHRIGWHESTGDGLVIIVEPDTPGSSDPDVTFPGRTRNLLKINADCTVQWIVNEIPHPDEYYPDVSEEYHRTVINCSDGIIETSSNTGRRHEINLESGAICNSWYRTNWKDLIVDSTVIRAPDGKLRLPYEVKMWEAVENHLLLILNPDSDGAEDPDFEVPASRPVVAITPDCQLAWIVDELPDTNQQQQYQKVFVLGDRVIIRSINASDVKRIKGSPKRYHELDPDTGDVIESWSSARFKFGEEWFAFDEPIREVQWAQGVTLLGTNETIYGFSDDGTKLWERPRKYDWHLYVNDDGLIKLTGYDRPQSVLLLNPKTGEIIEHVAGPGAELVDQ